MLRYCDERGDDWSSEVALRCHAVHELAAAEAQYHKRCYYDFRRPSTHETIAMYDDQAMKLLADEMNANQKLCSWTSIELYEKYVSYGEKYVSYGGQLAKRHMFTKLVTSLDTDMVALNIEGCASIVGFREYVSKNTHNYGLHLFSLDCELIILLFEH